MDRGGLGSDSGSRAAPPCPAGPHAEAPSPRPIKAAAPCRAALLTANPSSEPLPCRLQTLAAPPLESRRPSPLHHPEDPQEHRKPVRSTPVSLVRVPAPRFARTHSPLSAACCRPPRWAACCRRCPTARLGALDRSCMSSSSSRCHPRSNPSP
jgi:hypothetical protein